MPTSEIRLDTPLRANYFIENLTISPSGLGLWLRAVVKRLHGAGGRIHCYVIDGSWIAMSIAKVLGPLAGVKVERFEFRLIDVRDESGLLAYLSITHMDLDEVQKYVLLEPLFQSWISSGALKDRAGMFLAKNIVFGPIAYRGTLRRSMFLVQVALWKTQLQDPGTPPPIIVLERRPWFGAIVRYASSRGVSLVPVRPQPNYATILRQLLPEFVASKLRAIRVRVNQSGVNPFVHHDSHISHVPSADEEPELQSAKAPQVSDSFARVAVPFYGQLNLNRQDLHSDLAFWQRSGLAGSDVLLCFKEPGAPADSRTRTELKQHGIMGVAVNSGATVVPEIPVFTTSGNVKRGEKPPVSHLGSAAERSWLRRGTTEYHTQRNYWYHLFAAYKVQVYLTWYKYDASHMAIADALQELGGVTAIYQRSFEPIATPEATIGADVAFGFSQMDAGIEKCSNSVIQYHVITGYLGDHRFDLLRPSAQDLRAKLMAHGAKRILAFSDENSMADARWHTGHPLVRENYAFLLGKVLSDPWFGLVIKPKNPNTLRQRLGPVAEVLKNAESTGRCHVFEGGSIQGSFPPAAAALAADIAVHGHLSGGTAALEQALAGVPTLMMDREGWAVSPLYKLGVGRVVFHDWDNLWQACLDLWSDQNSRQGIGDWSPLLDDLDPFRDGKAADRMGAYIQWLIEGFRDGHNRDKVMADAAQRYCSIWGNDKVTQILPKLTIESSPEPNGYKAGHHSSLDIGSGENQGAARFKYHDDRVGGAE